MSLAIIWGVVVTLFGFGLLGIFVPVLPGILLVFTATLFYGLATDFSTISITTVVVFGVVALLAWLFEWMGSVIGAKVGGGKWPTISGSLVGSMAGFILSGPPGLLIGAFLGALIGALYEGQSVKDAGRAALMSVVGLLGATVIQAILAVFIILSFLIAVFV